MMRYLLLAAVAACSGSSTAEQASALAEYGELEEAAAGPLPDYDRCIEDIEADLSDCEDDCVAAHPDDPNPDPVACDHYEGTSFLQRLICIETCRADADRAHAECCRTGAQGGRAIDWGGDSPQARACNAYACWGEIHASYVSCLQNYGGYTGHDHHGDPCKMDVFGYCDHIFNSGYDICTPAWRVPNVCATGCAAALPANTNALIAQLGDDNYFTREAAEAQLRAALRELMQNNPSDLQCVINKIRDAFWNHPSRGDPEVAARLNRIWSNLALGTLAPIPHTACAQTQ